MTLKDVLREAVIYLGLDELLNVTELDGESTATASETKILQLLTACTNCVVEEIACDYFPLLKNEKVTPNNDCEILYSSLSKVIHKVKSIKDMAGNNVKYVEYPKYFKVDYPYQCEIVYSYLPNRVANMNDIIDIVDVNVNLRTLVLGVVCEYCLITNRVAQAQTYDTRYKDAILAVSTKKGEMVVKSRRWK